MSDALTLEPDPFDKVVERMLNDPAFLADLDETNRQLESGEMKTYTDEEVRAKLVEWGVPVDDEPSH